MMPEDGLWRDELALRRRERDHHREPGERAQLPGNARLERRLAFHASIAAAGTEITGIECPSCRGPVFAPDDSDGERVDCFGCDARLVTVRHIEGVTAIEIERGDR